MAGVREKLIVAINERFRRIERLLITPEDEGPNGPSREDVSLVMELLCDVSFLTLQCPSQNSHRHCRWRELRRSDLR